MIEVIYMPCENHAKTEERLERLEKQVDQLTHDTHSSALWQAKADLRFEMLSEKIEKLDGKIDSMDIRFSRMFEDLQIQIKEIAGKPTKRIDQIINTGITVVTSTAVAYLIATLFK